MRTPSLAVETTQFVQQRRSCRRRRTLRNPVTNRVRAIRKQPVLAKPAQQGLGYDLTRQLRELITPVTTPEAMLVTVNADGTVDVVPELAAA